MLGRDDASKPPQEQQPGLYDKVLGALGFGGKPQEKPETTGTTADTTSPLSKISDESTKASTVPADSVSPALHKQDSGSSSSSSESGSSSKVASGSKPLHPDAYPLTATDIEANKASAPKTTEYERPFSQEVSHLKDSKSSHTSDTTGVGDVTRGVEAVKISRTETPAKDEITTPPATEGLAAAKTTSISTSSSSSSSSSEAEQPKEGFSTGGITTPHVTSGVATAHGGTGKPGVVASSAVPTATFTAPSPGVSTTTTGGTTEHPSEEPHGTPGAHNAQGKKGMLGKVTDKAKSVVSVLHEKAHDTKQKVGEKMQKK